MSQPKTPDFTPNGAFDGDAFDTGDEGWVDEPPVPASWSEEPAVLLDE